MELAELSFSLFEAVVFWVLAVLWLAIVLVVLMRKKEGAGLLSRPSELARLFIVFSLVLEALAIYWGLVHSSQAGLFFSRFVSIAPAAPGDLTSKLFLLVVGFMFLYVVWNKSLEGLATQAEYAKGLARLTEEVSGKEGMVKALSQELEEKGNLLQEKLDEIEKLTQLTIARELRIAELKENLKDRGREQDFSDRSTR